MPFPTYASWPGNDSFKGAVCETPVLQQQPLQQHQGVQLQKKPKSKKKTFQDFFQPCGKPVHQYPVVGHPLCG